MSESIKYPVGTSVNYINGWQQTGTIMQIYHGNYVICDPTNEAQMILWNAGYAVGDCIAPSQILSIY